MHLIAQANQKNYKKRLEVKGDFPSRHSANESIVEIPNDSNPMNQTLFIEKKILQKSYIILLNQTSPYSRVEDFYVVVTRDHMAYFLCRMETSYCTSKG
jgi:hypothetical protein